MNVDVNGREQVIRQKQIGLHNEHVKDLTVLEPIIMSSDLENITSGKPKVML